jgi:BirA family biotin operon repressor/biotin-[acetyl-CoA-carboxylase] ligase
VNVQWTTFPPELADLATACNLEAGRAVDRDALLEHYLEGLGYHLDALVSVPGEYRERLGTLGRRVRVEQAGGALTGAAVDVRDAGELVVRDDTGAEHTITTADVVHLRPA